MANENIFTTLGASNHAKEEREKNDFYATDNIVSVPSFGDSFFILSL